MIKTLRITSVIAAILACVLFAFPVVFGVRNNVNLEEFLNSPGAIEKFRSTEGKKAKKSESQSSPLVQQAEAFAKYLNPPKSIIPKTSAGLKTASISRDLPVTPKFKVLGTCYYASNPEMSLALIDEPGKGRHWVRQSSNVGHLLIEQIKDGLVVIKSSEETFELMIEEKPESSFLKGAPTVSTETGSESRIKSTLPALGRAAASARKTIITPPQPQINAEEGARAEELISKLKDLQTSSKSDKTNSGPSDEERNARIKELISRFKSARVSTEEAKSLGNLGEKLKGIEEDPNQSLPATDEGKIETSLSESDVSPEK